MNLTVQQLVDRLHLQPHPEGGFYKETYRCTNTTNHHNKPEKRSACTAIYFLLVANNFSAFHQIRSDEIWHFYKGCPIHLHTISPQGKYEEIIISNDISKNHHPQYVVPAGYWFASEVKMGYTLCGCTVSPGFDFNDFQLAEAHKLQHTYPQHADIISRLTRI